jgi:hypothetical protein
MGDTQIFLHILQEVKASMHAKRGLKLLFIDDIILMVCIDYDGYANRIFFYSLKVSINYNNSLSLSMVAFRS